MTIGNVDVTPKDLTRSGGSGAGNRVVLMGYASGGTASGLSNVSNSSVLEAAIGNGILRQYGGPTLDAKGDQLFYQLAGSGGSISAVTQSGSGPLITLSGTPTRSFTGKVKITTAGTVDGGAARFKVSLDGTTYDVVRDIKPRTAATMVGTVDMTALTLSTLNTKHFTCTGDDAAVADFTMVTYASVALLIAALNGGIVADGSNCVVDTTLRAGKYLVVKSGTLGATSTITAAAGDGMDELGLNGQSAVGTDSTYLIPGTGITITFPTGTYVLDEVYSFTTVAPVVALATYTAAIALLPRDGSVDFSAIAIVHEWTDEHEMHTYMTSLASTIAAWQTSEPYRAVGLLCGTPLGSATSSASTIQTNDNAVRVKFASTTSRDLWWAHGDVFLTSSDQIGSFRASALIKLLLRFVTLDLSRSIGDREAEQDSVISLTGPSGTVYARDERTALTAMVDRWSVVFAKSGVAYFMTGRTASTSNGFNELAWIRPFYLAMQETHDELENHLEITPPLLPDGKMREERLASIDNAVNGKLAVAILNPTGAGTQQRASSCSYRGTRSNIFGTTKALVGVLNHQANGIAHSATVAANLTTEIA